MTSRIAQFVASLMPRDAIGGHVLRIDDTLRVHGVASSIFAGSVDPTLAPRARNYRSFTGDSRDGHTLLLYHSSIGSPVGPFVAARSERLVVDYHNITPPEYFYSWDPRMGVNLELGRDQLAGLVGRTSVALADSGFNAGELRGFGFAPVVVVPILLDVEALVRAVPSVPVRWPRGDGARWLFVGRLAPNKAQHDVLKAFAWYRRVFDPGASLTLVGGASAASYEVALSRFVAALELSDVVRLTGSVPVGELEGLYRSADVFVCLSEHEGFCVPLLESLAHGVPVVAFGAAAVPETLGDAGLVLGSKRPQLVAEAVARLVGDDRVRRALVAAGYRRLEEFALARSQRRLMDALTPLLDIGASA